ncbi:hypothetical protein BU17DRAFT_35761 [Hysterangium stoloniferum]|nr:hypothetical protein BU17DRAFT_35761 [Hysterangium stoloniferum]
MGQRWLPSRNATEIRSTTVELGNQQYRRKHSFTHLVFLLSSLILVYFPGSWYYYSSHNTSNTPINAARILSRCAELDVLPGTPPNFHARTESDRYQSGNMPTLIHNATIWTGNGDGWEQVNGDILLDRGIIKWVGGFRLKEAKSLFGTGLTIVDVKGAWVTPGLVDIHSHAGVMSYPQLSGAADTNSILGITQPWLRSLDGLNTHDEEYPLIVAGGVTTSHILPGSANAIGGQAFTIKNRPTLERSSSSRLVEQMGSPNSTGWRHLKQACGENPSRTYAGTRMDTAWALRTAYDEARKLKLKQDRFCAAAMAGKWNGLGEFPDDLKWEALVDVLRGKVKVHNHCYEAVDFDSIVRLTNEFKFPIAAFHHAQEAYLVPDLIKKAWGPPPALAIFATFARIKREAYRGSEFAPRILADNGLRVIMKVRTVPISSRNLLYEAQQAHYYGLPDNIALASVTTTPAAVLGLDHRIGSLKAGAYIDVVVWDSHPLALGATPKQVYIDGIAQLKTPYNVEKPGVFQDRPITPNFDKEAAQAIEYEGLPPLRPSKVLENIVFTNVNNVWSRVDSGTGIQNTFDSAAFSNSLQGRHTVVVVENGRIKCAGSNMTCQTDNLVGFATVDLQGGSLAPGFITYGAPIGIAEIGQEPSTKDGDVFDVLSGTIPAVLGGDGAVVVAVDGLQFSTRDALLAYRTGMTTAVTPPDHSGVVSGLSTFFSTGANHKLEKDAVIQDVAALHVTVGYQSNGSPSVSTQIALLRNLLSGEGKGQLGEAFKFAAEGALPLVVKVESLDIIATLVQLKKEIDLKTGKSLRLTLSGAAEAHLIAEELGQAGVGVIVLPTRPIPAEWQSRRILPGLPLSEKNAIATLVAHNVTVGIGCFPGWAWTARNTRFDVAWAALDSPDFSKEQALSLVSSNLEILLGIRSSPTDSDMVVYKGGDPLAFSSKVVGIISSRRGSVDLL